MVNISGFSDNEAKGLMVQADQGLVMKMKMNGGMTYGIA